MVRLFLILGVLAFAVALYTAVDVLLTNNARIKVFPKPAWVALALIPVIGAVLWFSLGKDMNDDANSGTGGFMPSGRNGEGALGSAAESPKRRLESDSDERIRSLEERLRQLEEEEFNMPGFSVNATGGREPQSLPEVGDFNAAAASDSGAVGAGDSGVADETGATDNPDSKD
ncbi:PLDc N-terminal domain-containing protein [Canibacter sp. lx-72]|uniref:PLD nuclease N-terminal domain-containing protein n=1 Tax=Canibacter zhuwentaonis TaxID=2837491 RepID=UPI001BDD4F65|nr:PLD nuclease N-terminal domain-containing protein [Canibacter zhuwentaonis]MBT1018626.1 PLDc N-terminal domain-containing protein [Canibacter zhuwentaonis]